FQCCAPNRRLLQAGPPPRPQLLKPRGECGRQFPRTTRETTSSSMADTTTVVATNRATSPGKENTTPDAISTTASGSTAVSGNTTIAANTTKIKGGGPQSKGQRLGFTSMHERLRSSAG